VTHDVFEKQSNSLQNSQKINRSKNINAHAFMSVHNQPFSL